MTLSEMKRVLSEGNIQLTKSLGQNFLHDGNQLRRIAAAANLSAGDKVLEIGPGLGPLTELLVAQAGEVLAIEKDRRLAEYLQQRFSGQQNLRVLHADALDYLREHRRPWGEWKMVSNLPYSVASPLLVELAQSDAPPLLLVATLQLEVARRLTAQPGESDYGILTLLLQLRYEPVERFKIPASCFFPEPEVASGCVKLQRRNDPLLSAEEASAFTRLIKLSFSQRRKMMFKLLKGAWPAARLAEAFRHLQLSPQVRAEAVSLPQFVELSRRLSHP